MYWNTLAQVATSDFTTTSATLVDITGLTFAAATNSLYEIEASLKAQSSDTNGMKFTVAYSAAAATGAILYLGPAASTTFTGVTSALGTAEATALVTTATTDAIIFIKAVITTGANAGNITVQVQKVTAGTATIYVGSIMKIRKLA